MLFLLIVGIVSGMLHRKAIMPALFLGVPAISIQGMFVICGHIYSFPLQFDRVVGLLDEIVARHGPPSVVGLQIENSSLGLDFRLLIP